MKIAISGAAAVAVLISVPAFAQEGAEGFNGPRIEARAGWDHPNLEVSLTDGVDSITRDAGKDGVSYGGEVGYDHRSNNLMIGGYVGIEGSTTKECGELYGEDRLCIRSGRNITAGVRVGVVLDPSFMLYGKGGYSNGRATVDYQDYELILSDVDEGRNFDGFHLGAGLETQLPGGIYGRLEYVYTGYGKATISDEEVTAGLKPSRHQVLYGMGVRF
jgi:outer membrane immunogenic protein